ncbi:MAG: malonyl-CoA synthase [Pseudomonadota bacterium]
MTSPKNENLFVSLWEQVPDTSAPFLHLPDGTTMTYDALSQRANQFASALQAAGVKAGDRVAAQIDKSAEGLCLYFGCLKAGGVFLPLNTAYTDSEVAYFLGDAEPTVLICQPSRVTGLEKIAEQSGVAKTFVLAADGTGTITDAADASSTNFEAVYRNGDDLAGILYTSGTTGRSKGAMISGTNLLSNALALKEAWRFTSSDILLHALPVFHTHGLFVATHTLFVAGGSMIFHPTFNAQAVLSALPQATTMMGVPTFYTRLLNEPTFDKERVKAMRLFVSGSAPLSAQTHKDFEARTGHAIIERYGMTETNMNTSNPYDGERRAGTVGKPLPGIEVRVADPETGTPLPTGETGAIELRGPNVFQGYWRMPEKTKAEFRDDGFFISGDLGRYDEDGYLSIVGRDKDLIISGGFNVYPAEVESVLDALDGVAESAVIGIPHPDFGEGVTALVVPRNGANLQADAIQSAAAQKLAKFKVPKIVLIVDELPRNSMGKVTKKALRETHQDLFA